MLKNPLHLHLDTGERHLIICGCRTLEGPPAHLIVGPGDGLEQAAIPHEETLVLRIDGNRVIKLGPLYPAGIWRFQSTREGTIFRLRNKRVVKMTATEIRRIAANGKAFQLRDC